MKTYIQYIILGISMILVGGYANAGDGSNLCASGNCSNPWGQQQGQSNSVDNSNHATAAPTSVLSSNMNVFGGNSQIVMDGISCPTDNLFVVGNGSTTSIRPGTYNSDTLGVGAGVNIALGTGECSEAQQAKLYMYKKLNQESDFRTCMALRNDGLMDIVYDEAILQEFPAFRKCQPIFQRMRNYPDQFSNMPPSMKEATMQQIRQENKDMAERQIFKK